jgi:hypothetical protein
VRDAGTRRRRCATKSTTVTVEEVHLRFPKWNRHIDASGRYRVEIRDVMEAHDVTPYDLAGLVERVADAGYELDDTVEETDRFDDLAALVEESQGLDTWGPRPTRTDPSRDPVERR